LTQVTQANNTTESYSYDAVGNRTASLGVSSYTTNASNELTATSNASYTYDSNGNTLTKTVGSDTTSYTWDYENRLTSVTLPGSGGTVSFKYDPFGRRIEKSTSNTTSIFAYDGGNLIEETSATGIALARYTHSNGIDQPLNMLRSAITSYYEADGLGSVTSLTNATGSLVQTYAYDSRGKLTATSGSLISPFQFTGREFDAETGLYNYRARYLDPESGRFISEDPIGFSGGGNFYTYASNSPTGIVDPTGFAPCRIPLYCDPGVLKAVNAAYMKAVLSAGGFTAGGAETEAGFEVTPTQSCGYNAGPIVSGDRNSQLSIPLPTAAGGATFHTHMRGSGMPSTPKNNVAGSSDKGDTLAAVQSGFDVYVISGNGLAIAPANSKDPTSGKDSHFVIQGNNFADWYKALRALCDKIISGK